MIIQIAACNGNPAQQWVLGAAGDLVNPQANKCQDIKDWNSDDRVKLTVWNCAGTQNQNGAGDDEIPESPAAAGFE